ncbi:MAG TPA: hypothetical protein VLM37_09635, partial [Fibrobacteraceae bacterium]|nr:hypothetical protein [Fibrobacteraceae bacterium]
MSGSHKIAALEGEISLNPDREGLLYAMTLGALARGRTILEDCPSTPASDAYAEWLRANNVPCEHKESYWEIEGAGFAASHSPFQKLPEDLWARFLALCVLSRDHDTLFDFGAPAETLPILNDFSGHAENGRWLFTDPNLSWKLSPSGEIPHLTRVRILLQALLHGQELLLEEKAIVRDQLSGLMAFFGAPLQTSTSGTEGMDELARRMARLQGQRMDRTYSTHLEPCKTIAGKELLISGDPTEACAMALLASFIPASTLTLRNICLNPSRAGIFSALKRMGANVDFVQKRERYGDQYGSVRIQSCKKMLGRRLSPDLLMTCLEEVPLLAVAASLAEGESILRLPDHEVEQQRPLLEWVAENLK